MVVVRFVVKIANLTGVDAKRAATIPPPVPKRVLSLSKVSESHAGEFSQSSEFRLR